MSAKIIKLHKTEHDHCAYAAEQIKEIISENPDIVGIAWVGVSKNGQAWYGKDIAHEDKIALIGALACLNANLLESIRADEDA